MHGSILLVTIPTGQPLGQVLPFGPGGGEFFEAILSWGYGGVRLGQIKTISSLWFCEVQWNPVNTDTKGTCHSVRIIQVSVLSRRENGRNACFIDI